MKYVRFVLISTLALLTLTACDQEKVSFETAESSRMVAHDNAEYNAKSFRASNPQYVKYSISIKADSSITVKCPQGDGWASVDLVDIESGYKAPLKCSTVSASIGCMTDQEFKGKDVYIKQNDACDYAIPFPLPKLVN